MKYKLLIFSAFLLLFGCKEDFSVWKAYNEKWLADNKENYIDSLLNDSVKDGYVDAGITKSGIQYIIYNKGNVGEAIAKLSSYVKVKYRYWLIDGSNAGYDTGEEAWDMTKYTAGVQEMLFKYPKGSKFKLFIPWNLAYGQNGLNAAAVNRFFIPPYSTIIADMEIIDVFQNSP